MRSVFMLCNIVRKRKKKELNLINDRQLTAISLQILFLMQFFYYVIPFVLAFSLLMFF